MILQVFAAIIPVFLIVGAGALFHRFAWIDPAAESGLMRLNLTLFYPSFILAKVIGDPVLRQPQTVVWSIASGYLVVVIGLILSGLAAGLLRFRTGEGRRTFTVVTAIQNYGFMALPVLVALFGDGPLGVLFLHGMGVELAMWTLGVMVLRGISTENWRSVINGPCIAVVGGLILHYLGAEHWLPAPILATFKALGTCAVPIALFAIGAAIAGQAEMEPWSLQPRTVLGSGLMRLGVIPAAILALAHALPVTPEIKKVLLVQAAMPAAVFPIILARIYGGHPATAIQIVLATTIFSLGTMPLVLKWGARWLEL